MKRVEKKQGSNHRFHKRKMFLNFQDKATLSFVPEDVLMPDNFHSLNDVIDVYSVNDDADAYTRIMKGNAFTEFTKCIIIQLRTRQFTIFVEKDEEFDVLIRLFKIVTCMKKLEINVDQVNPFDFESFFQD